MSETAQIDPEWRELPAARRDILVVLAHDGPLTGQDLADRIRRSRSRTQEHLRVLRGENLVATDGPRNGRDNKITTTGMALLHRAYIKPTRDLDDRRRRS